MRGRESQLRWPCQRERAPRVGFAIACRYVLALSLLAGACAGAKTARHGTQTGSDGLWPGLPDARTAQLAAAAGDDALVLAMIHPDAWKGLGRLLTRIEGYDALIKQYPWIKSDNLWHPMRVLLGLEQAHPAYLPATPKGWDSTRPLALALVDSDPRGLLARYNATFLDGEDLPTHLRILIPASDPSALARALEDELGSLSGQPTHPGRYLLEIGSLMRLAVGVVPAEGHVRLELLYSGNQHTRTDSGDELGPRLARALQPPRQPSTKPASDPITGLLVNGRGVSVRVRLPELARRLLLEAPMKLKSREAFQDPNMEATLTVVGIGEILDGYLLGSAGEPELAEVAFALEIDTEIRATSLTRLTSAGHRQLAGFLDKTATPLAISSKALLGLSIRSSDANGAKQVEPLFSPEFRVTDSEELRSLVERSGLAGWLALMSRPSGLWRSSLDGGNPKTDTAGQALIPTDLSFELVDLQPEMKPVFRVRWRMPQGEPGTSPFTKLVKKYDRTLKRSHATAIEEERRANETVATWSVNTEGIGPAGSPLGQAQAPLGTFFLSRWRPAVIADKLERNVPSDKADGARCLLDLLKLFEHGEGSLGWQNGWLVGQARIAPMEDSKRHTRVPALENKRATVPNTRPSLGPISIERAAVRVRELLRGLSNIAPNERVPAVTRQQDELQSDLRLAKLDPSLQAEAAAIDRLLSELKKRLEPHERR